MYNILSLIEKQSEPTLDSANSKRKLKYQINKNASIAKLKYRIVDLFKNNNSKEILLELQTLFEKDIEPVRKGRKYPRRIRGRCVNGKHHTLTNYKRAI